jgi:hypothetical protein
MRIRLLSLVLASAGAVAGQAPSAAGFEVALRDGSLLTASTITFGAGSFTARGASTRTFAARELLAVHGVAVKPHALPSVELQAGDVWRGALLGGDKSGEWLELQSPCVGTVRVPIDRIACVLLRPDLATAAELRLPTGVAEALFAKAALGFDVVAGTLHQFGRDGLLFQRQGDDAPKWYRDQDLVGMKVADPAAPKSTPAFELLTRSGDRLAVDLRSWKDGVLHAVHESGQQIDLRDGDLACLSALGGGLVPLSSLQPDTVDERGVDSDVLLPWQKDRSVTGGALGAGGRGHCRGIGVHSQSRLTFLVPDGASAFTARVGIDDSALSLQPRADVEVRVQLDDVEVLRAPLRAGDPPRALGLVPVKKGQRLLLAVDFGKGRDLADRVDWLTPVFLPAK